MCLTIYFTRSSGAASGRLRRCSSRTASRFLGAVSIATATCVLAFEMETWQIPKIFKNVGPEIYSRHAEQFLKHYKGSDVFIEDDNWVVETEREFTTVEQFFKDLLKKSAKGLLESGIPSKIAPLMKRCKFCGNDDALKAIKKLPIDFRVFLAEWFEKDLNVV